MTHDVSRTLKTGDAQPRHRAAARALVLFLAPILCAVLLDAALFGATAHAAQSDEAGQPAVVRAGGATLYNDADGLPVETLTPGSMVTLYARSDDAAWLFGESEQGLAGWLAAADLIAVNVPSLPARAVSTPPMEDAAPADQADSAADINATNAVTVTDPLTDTLADTGADIATEIRARVNVTDARLNVRSGPGTGFHVVDKLLPGSRTRLTARDASGAWVQVRSGQDEPLGWVSAEFVDADDAIEALPVAAADAVEPASASGMAAAPTASSSTGAQAAGGGLRGKIVLRGSDGMLYVYHLGTGALVTLTDGIDPALSPDGSQVAFTRDGGRNGLYVINVDGSGERLVFGERPKLRAPKWSPDGKQILFVRGDEFLDCYLLEDGRCMEEQWLRVNKPWIDIGELARRKEPKYKLSLVDAAGGGFRDLPSLSTAQAPDWNGDNVVYQSRAGLQVLAADADAPGLNDLLYFDILKQFHQDPDWQPVDGTIVFQQKEASHWEIFAINPDGSGRHALTRPATVLVDMLPSNVAPAWSPDGRAIAFLSSRTGDNNAGPWRVWVMAADGSGQRPLPVNVALEYGFGSDQVLDWGP